MVEGSHISTNGASAALIAGLHSKLTPGQRRELAVRYVLYCYCIVSVVVAIVSRSVTVLARQTSQQCYCMMSLNVSALFHVLCPHPFFRIYYCIATLSIYVPLYLFDSRERNRMHAKTRPRSQKVLLPLSKDGLRAQVRREPHAPYSQTGHWWKSSSTFAFRPPRRPFVTHQVTPVSP
jgi:hypothetical protein